MDKIPDDQYLGLPRDASGKLLQPEWQAAGLVIPDAAWGPPTNGLRAAVLTDAVTVRQGDRLKVWLILENVAGTEIRFGCSDVIQGSQATLIRSDGTRLPTSATWFTGISPIQRFKLAPGERMTLATKSLSVIRKGATTPSGDFGGEHIVLDPGQYGLTYGTLLPVNTARSRQADGRMHRILPAAGEWQGPLSTGTLGLQVVGAGGTGLPPLRRSRPAPERMDRPAAVQPPAGRGITLTILDAADGAPVSGFAVIAGTPSALDPRQPVINWQPHTLRTGSLGRLVWPLDRAYDQTAFRVEAPGYLPYATEAVKKSAGARMIDCRLERASPVAGRVQTPDGRPAAGAVIALAMVQREAVLEGAILRAGKPAGSRSDQWRLPRRITADATGAFELPPENDPTAAVLILHDSGVRELALKDCLRQPEITLQPWARMQGQLQWAGITGSNRVVLASIHRDTYGYPGVIAQYARTTSSIDGSFVFERLLPGTIQVSSPMSIASTNATRLGEISLDGLITHPTLQPGLNRVMLGGVGRTVKGRLSGRESWAGANIEYHFHTRAPHFGFGGDNEIWAAWTAFQQTSVGALFARGGLRVDAAGAFEIPQMLPGSYQIFFTDPATRAQVATGQFTVPPEVPGTRPEPLTIGPFGLPPVRR